MTGTHFNGKETELDTSVNPQILPEVLKIVGECLHEVDGVESGDYNPETSKQAIYDKLHRLGHKMFGE